MKKIFSVFLALVMVIAAVPAVSSSAVTAEESLQYLEYEIKNGEVCITGCDESATEIVIPHTIEGYPVKFIEQYAFASSGLTSVVIPESVTNIERAAFACCENLTSAIIFAKIKKIEKQLFYECTKLNSVILPDSVVYIDDSAFAKCRALTTIAIPDGVKTIGVGAFAHCSALSAINIPYRVKYIYGAAFTYCDNLKTVNYGGTEDEWGYVSVYGGNDSFVNAEFVYSSVPNHIKANINGVVNRYDIGETITVDSPDLIKRNGKYYVFEGWTSEGVEINDASSASVTFVVPHNDVLMTVEGDKLYGDVDGDGRITALDMIEIKKIIKFDSAEDRLSADIDLNGLVNLIDCIFIKSIIKDVFEYERFDIVEITE